MGFSWSFSLNRTKSVINYLVPALSLVKMKISFQNENPICKEFSFCFSKQIFLFEVMFLKHIWLNYFYIKPLLVHPVRRAGGMLGFSCGSKDEDIRGSTFKHIHGYCVLFLLWWQHRQRSEWWGKTRRKQPWLSPNYWNIKIKHSQSWEMNDSYSFC